MTPLFVNLLGQRCTGTCDGDTQAQLCGCTCAPPSVHEAFFFCFFIVLFVLVEVRLHCFLFYFLFFISFVVGIALSLHCTPVVLLCFILLLYYVHCTVVVCRAFLKISYRAEEIYPAKIKVYLSIYLSIYQ